MSYNAALFRLLDQEAERELQAYRRQLPFRAQARQALAKLCKRGIRAWKSWRGS